MRLISDQCIRECIKLFGLYPGSCLIHSMYTCLTVLRGAQCGLKMEVSNASMYCDLHSKFHSLVAIGWSIAISNLISIIFTIQTNIQSISI